MPSWDAIWINARLATMAAPDYGLVEAGAVACKGGRIAWAGDLAALPGRPEALAAIVHDVGGRVLTPGLVDCHTHLVHAGTRWREFAMRLAGAGREEIAAAGGGVQGTVRGTREASEEELLALSLDRARRLLAAGITTVESKSGYGLDLDTELRMMRVSREIGRLLPLSVRSTYLGAHGVAPEYRGRPDDYIEFMCSVVLPAAVREGLVDAVDGFCDAMGFSHAQIGRLFAAAASNGLPVKAHADQYTDFGAGGLVARHGGLSADHLEWASEATIRAMAESGTVAVLLPGASWTLDLPKRPPVDLFRSHEVPMALATNCNPGSSPSTSPMAMMNMACRLFGLTPEEAVAGFTREGARALGLAAECGTIEIGKAADLAIWDVTHPAELAYFIGDNRCHSVVKAGRVVFSGGQPP